MMENRSVSIQDVLRAREERAAKQLEMRNRHASPVLSFTMNIAGSIKNNAEITCAFQEGKARILRQLKRMKAAVLSYEETIAFTGCEALWAVDADAQELKKRMCAIEEADALGRLFDIDVLDADGAHLSRGEERTCLVCGGPVRACARSRQHTADEIFSRTMDIIREWMNERFVQLVGENAQRALLYEALTTPKPGLVDCENSGAHSDMDLFSFAASACTLRNYFETCVRLGMEKAPAKRLQYAGMEAEDAMLAAAGANTHKGAIFSLGILCCAAGYCGETASMDELLQQAARLGSVFLQQMKSSPGAATGGEQQYLRYGLTGARGEAASGFATARSVALPLLEENAQDAGLHALLALMAQVQDSNIIRRAGMEGQQWAMEQAKQMLENNWTKDDLRRMNDAFTARGISPGGSADLLAVAYFLHFWKCRRPIGCFIRRR